MKVRLKSFLLAIVMVITMIPNVSLATTFSDIPNDWSKEALENAVSNGLLTGFEGKLMPKDNLTRAQMATIINRAFGAKGKASLAKFNDVESGTWYFDEMAKAVQMKTFVGDGNKLFPDDNITREEAFVVLARAFKLSGANESGLNKFSDKDLVSQWAKDGVASLVSSGYIAGSDGKLNPKQNITRAEFAQIMYNLLKNYINVAGTYTNVEDGNVMINTPDVVLKDLTVKGDLIIGDGVGDGDVTLDNVTVTGRVVVRGGGINSIIITGNSNIQNIVIARVDGKVRVFAEGGTEVGEVIVDGYDDVIVEGKIASVSVVGTDITLTATNAEILTANVTGNNSKIIVGKTSTIGTLNLDSRNATVEVAGKVTNVQTTAKAEGAAINVAGGATIDKVVAEGKGTSISGSGSVKAVEANANDIAVTTPNTAVTAAKGTTGVTAGGKVVEPGTTVGKVETPPAGGGGFIPSPVVNVSAISVTGEGGAVAVVVNETLKMNAVFTPEDASNKTVTWSVANGTGTATIDANGLLTANTVGEVTVKATANNGVTGQITITIGVKVTNSDELVKAITDNMSHILISGTIGSIDAYTAYEITTPVNIKGLEDAKVYGSFVIKTDDVTIDGLTMYTRGGGNGPLKAAIDVIAKSVKITNNIFELPNPQSLAEKGGVGNGVTIWPHGNASPNYVINGNTFKGYKADTSDWSSTGLQIAEGLELSRFNMAGVISDPITLDAEVEKDLATGNNYEDCTNSFIHSDWTSGIKYKYVLALTSEQLSSGLKYAGENATIVLIEDTYDLKKNRILINKGINLIGEGYDKTIVKGTVHRAGTLANDIVQPMLLTTSTVGSTLIKGIHFEWVHDEEIGSNNFSALSLAGKNITVTECKITTNVPNTNYIAIVNIGRTGGSVLNEAGVAAESVTFTNNIVDGTISIVPSVAGKPLNANVSDNTIKAVNMEGIWTYVLNEQDELTFINNTITGVPSGMWDIKLMEKVGKVNGDTSYTDELISQANNDASVLLQYAVATVKTEAELKAALTDTNKETIYFANNISLSETLKIERSVVIDGKTYSVDKALNIAANNVTIKNLEGKPVNRALHGLSGIESGVAFYVSPGMQNVVLDSVKVDGTGYDDGNGVSRKSIGVMGSYGASLTVMNSAVSNVTTGIFANSGYSNGTNTLTAIDNIFDNVWAGIGGTERTILSATENHFSSKQTDGEGIGLGNGVKVIGNVSESDTDYLAKQNKFDSTYSDNDKVKDYRQGNWGTILEWRSSLDSIVRDDLQGYSCVFEFEDFTISDVKSLVISLYEDTSLLQTNTLILEGNIGTGRIPENHKGISTSFKVSGTYDYSTDGYWTVSEESILNRNDVEPDKVELVILLKSGDEVTGFATGPWNQN